VLRVALWPAVSCFEVSYPPFLQMRPQKHKVKTLCQAQVLGYPPQGHPSPTLSPPIWAVSAGQSHPDLGSGRCWHLPHPRPGVWTWAGMGQLKQDYRPGLTSDTSGCLSRVRGEIGEGDCESSVHTQPAVG
jgi:hypothetical protein